MQEMTNDEKLLYEILMSNDDYKSSNDKCVKEFIYQKTGYILPKLDISLQTIYRKIRLLKSTYPELRGSKEIQDAKLEKIDEYKEMALDRNRPMKTEETKLELWW